MMGSYVKPKKALGQHFLTDLDVARRIAETVDTEPYQSLPILEVGPGTGVLTQFLMQTGRELKVVEIDTESVDYLHTEYPGLDVEEADFLTMDLSALFGGREFVLTGNYPYNISSQIFFKMLDYKELIPMCTGMLQREVAQRLCAGPGSKTYGILSVLLDVWYDREYLFTVSEHVFNPPPKVKSGVIRLKRNGRTELPCRWEGLRTVVKTAFGQRRKTLRNSLSGILPPGFDLGDLGGLRPEQLDTEQFIELASRLYPVN